MILDSMENIRCYAGIPLLKEAIEYVTTHDVSTWEKGQYEINGDDFFVQIQEPVLKKEEDAKPEAHNDYVDLQIIFTGEEKMGLVRRDVLGDPVESYPEKDLYFFKGKSDPVLVKAGMFTVFFPWDAHATNIDTGLGVKEKKAVFKIRFRKD